LVGACGLVRMFVMKNHTVSRALSSVQAHSKRLRIYVQIELSERGKQLIWRNIATFEVVTSKNNKRLYNCESGGIVLMKP
jgi:hypothetical protein